MYDVVIFGGGIAGLTVAHELNKKGLKILLIEKESECGGMARSRIEPNQIPSEHSWRGYAPFYKNTIQIMKEIPYFDTTVFNNLSIPIEFYLLYDEKKKYRLTLNLKDRFILFYLGINYLLAGNRREYYYSYDIKPFLKKYLSINGYNFIINFITGPGYGMNKNEISMGHLMHFPVISYMYKGHHVHHHDTKNGGYTHKSTDGWHVMNGPTSDVWIKPWVKYLTNTGVDILNSAELVRIHHTNHSITSVKIKHQGVIKSLIAKEYVLSINPFNTVDIFKKSNMNTLHNTFTLLTNNTKSKHIAFRIGIHKKIIYPIQNIAFVMNDSEFNITWYPQEKHWKKKPNIESLWSGTIIDFEKKGTLFNKNAEELDIAKLKAEIIHQILRSESFQTLIYDNNGFYITKKDIALIEIWYEWSYINNKQEQTYKKWVNNIHNEPFRPQPLTNYKNLFLSGAHIKTTINIWSMEGAVESGKITANYILDKYKTTNITHYKHDDSLYIRIIQSLDNCLYAVHAPNVFNVMLYIPLIIAVIYVYKRHIKHIKR